MTSDLAARPEVGAGGAGVLVDSTPYPWPWDGAFNGRRCALLIVDTPDPVLSAAVGAWPVIAGLVESVRAAEGLVVQVLTGRPSRFTADDDRPADTNTPAVSSRFSVDISVTAPGWDGFFGTGLDGVLRNARRDLLLLAGGWLEVGVHSTMRSANDRGYECLLIPDACIAAGQATRAATISSTEMSGGIFGAVADSPALLALLTRPS